MRTDFKEKAREFAEGREGSVSLPLKLLAAVFGMAVLAALIYNAYGKGKTSIDEVNKSASDFINSVGTP